MSEINNIKPSIKPDVSNTRDSAAADRAQRQPAAATQTASTSKTEADKVSLSDTLTKLEQTMATMPVVDSKRVEAVKLAIENGSYQIDSHELARKMISFEGDF